MNESNQQFSNSNVNASPKSRLVLTLFAFFLGYLGVDRFYGGRILLGILKLLTFGFGGLWILIDFILAVCGVQKDENGRNISNW